MSYRSSLVFSISSVCSQVFSEIAPNEPSLPYAVIQEEDGTREGTTSGPFIQYQVRVDLFTLTRAEGTLMRDSIMQELDATTGDFWFVSKPSGVDVDSESGLFIHSVEISVMPK